MRRPDQRAVWRLSWERMYASGAVPWREYEQGKKQISSGMCPVKLKAILDTYAVKRSQMELF